MNIKVSQINSNTVIVAVDMYNTLIRFMTFYTTYSEDSKQLMRDIIATRPHGFSSAEMACINQFLAALDQLED